MNYQEARRYLLSVFKEKDFETKVKNNQSHTDIQLLHTCENQTQIEISFPGYKAKIDDRKITYDYRVDIKRKGHPKTSLSHVNIIIDMYNKIIRGSMDYQELMRVLLELSWNWDIDLNDIRSRLPYEPVHPDSRLMDWVESVHGTKVYNKEGNKADLDLEELFISMKWIVLQEDMNYPIYTGLEGRRMAFCRYIETIYVTQNTDIHLLEDVIQRTLSHTRPQRWDEINYSFCERIC